MPRFVNLDDVVRVAKQLATLDTRLVFTGGSIITLLLDQPSLSSVRVTNDVDVIAEVLTRIQYTDLEACLRAIGFRHDTSEDAPICRWIVDGIKVDVMPMHDPSGTLCNPWFKIAVATAQHRQVQGQPLLLVTAPCFLAMKIVAFNDRGGGDFRGSHDLEDILSVVDGRAALADELAQADESLRKFVSAALGGFLADERFLESLPGHLLPDEASQKRLPGLEHKLRAIAALR